MGKWHKTQCNMCGVSCAMEMEVEDNKIVNVRPDPDSPRTPHGYCCRKGRASKFFNDHEDRLDYPLKKVGDHFERISWEQAYKEIAEKTNAILDKHGPRSFSYCGGALGCAQGDIAFINTSVMPLIGSQWLYNPVGIEFMGSWWSHGRILGDQSSTCKPDESTLDVMILWGSNTYVAHNVNESRFLIRRLSEDPDKTVIVVDPRLSETARMADLHIPVRLGSDSLFIRGMLALILDEGWQNQAYIDKYVSDFELVKPWFKGFDYREAFRVCGVDYEDAREFCRLLCTKTWGVHQDLGLYCGRHNTTNTYLMLMLMAFTGNLLVKGNIQMDGFAAKGKSTNELDPKVWRTPSTNRFPVLGIYPTGVMGKEILSDKDDRIRCMWVSYGNPARSYPDSNVLDKAFEALELLVVVDICMTETAKHADYVLPGKTNFETYEFNTLPATFPNVTCMLKHPFLGQVGERKENTQIWFDIMKEMGYVPELPQSLYDAADKAVAERDRVGYFFKVIGFALSHPKYLKRIPLIICETLGRSYGSINRAMLWAALMTSKLQDKMIARAGWQPNPKHKFLNMLPPFKHLCTMDMLFQAVDDTPQGVVVAVSEPDRHQFALDHIKHKDKKVHLYCDEVNEYIKRLTPECEEKALSLTKEFPMVVSAGRHSDNGINTIIRNPNSYAHRQPYVMAINPEDAAELGIKDGQEVRVTTRAGSLVIPVEYTYQTSRGYLLIPHHFGLEFGGKTIGTGVNYLTSWDDMDDLTGNPYYRYVPCRVEAL